MKTNIISAKQKDAIKLAANALMQGELVAFPTDTVYGLGAMVDDPCAIERLYIVKNRPASKAIPVLIGKPADLEMITSQLGEYARKFAEKFWPGPFNPGRYLQSKSPKYTVSNCDHRCAYTRPSSCAAFTKCCRTVGGNIGQSFGPVQRAVCG